MTPHSRPLLLVGLASLVGAAFLAVATFTGVHALDLPVALVGELPASEPAVTPKHKVALVVLDGLRADVADEQPELQALMKNGGSALLVDLPPTYSAPQYAALLSGMPPRDSGIRTNDGVRPTGLDSVPAEVRAAGGHTAVISDCVLWWDAEFPGAFERVRRVAPDALQSELPSLYDADFLVVHTCVVDHAGHTEGAEGPEYHEAAKVAAQLAGAVAVAFQGSVAVVADHGHRLAGGHGGDEDDVATTRAVLIGPGVRPGSRLGTARNLDMAPTLSALAGVPAPRGAEGRTMVELLDVSVETAQSLHAADEARMDRVRAAVEKVRGPMAASAAMARWVRLGIAAVLLIAIGVFAVSRFRWLVAGVLCCGGAVSAYLLVHGAPSLSAARGSWRWLIVPIVVAFFGTLVGEWFEVRRHRGGVISGRKLALNSAAVALGASLFALAAFAVVGAFVPRVEIGPMWMTPLAMVAWAIGGAAALATFVTCIAAFVYELRRPSDPGLLDHEISLVTLRLRPK